MASGALFQAFILSLINVDFVKVLTPDSGRVPAAIERVSLVELSEFGG